VHLKISKDRFYLNPRRGPIESFPERAEKNLAKIAQPEIGIMGAEGPIL
jgi:hypothetical protein